MLMIVEGFSLSGWTAFVLAFVLVNSKRCFGLLLVLVAVSVMVVALGEALALAAGDNDGSWTLAALLLLILLWLLVGIGMIDGGAAAGLRWTVAGTALRTPPAATGAGGEIRLGGSGDVISDSTPARTCSTSAVPCCDAISKSRAILALVFWSAAAAGPTDLLAVDG